MTDQTEEAKRLLSVRLPPKDVIRVKVEAIQRGKNVSEADVVLEALNLYWRLSDKKIALSKLLEQSLAGVPIHEMDFGMKLSLVEKLWVLDQVMRVHFERVESEK